MDETPSWATDDQSTPDWAADSESLTPHTDQALKETAQPSAAARLVSLARTPSPQWMRPMEQGVVDVAKTIPSMITQLPGMAYRGYQLAAGSPQEKAQVAATMAAEGLQQGQQISSDVQHPIGSREWTRGAIQMGMMAAPGVELLREAPIAPEIEKPPIQGEPDASGITSTESVPEPEVRPQVGEEAPLRQQGETADAQEPVADASTVAAEVQTGADAPGAGIGEIAPVPEAEETPVVAEQPKPEEVGTNVKGFEKIYGAGEIPAGGSITPEEAWDIASERAATGKADPYGIVDRARTGAITPDEMGDLIYEHQRLVNEAAAAEGTPQYEELYQRARTFARNVVKPAENAAFHRTGMVMQIKAPIDYSNLTGFRAALEKRMGREMLPEEMPAFKKIVDEVNGAKKARNGAASEAMGKAINRFKGVKDISFEDAVKQIHDSLEEAAKPCKL